MQHRLASAGSWLVTGLIAVTLAGGVLAMNVHRQQVVATTMSAPATVSAPVPSSTSAPTPNSAAVPTTIIIRHNPETNSGDQLASDASTTVPSETTTSSTTVPTTSTPTTIIIINHPGGDDGFDN